MKKFKSSKKTEEFTDGIEKLREKYQLVDLDINDVIGSEEVKAILSKEILNYMEYKTEFEKRGMEHSKGVTIYGPPGVGKSLLARWVVLKLVKDGKMPKRIGILEIKGHEVAAGGVGSINKKIAQFFTKLREDMKALKIELMILIIDEIDATMPKRTTSSVLTRERTSSMLKELDGFRKNKENIYIIGTTNRPYDLDSAAREGRIGRQIFVDVPNEENRRKMIKAYITSKDIKFERNISGEKLTSKKLAKMTENYTGDNFKAIGSDLLNEYLDNGMKPIPVKKVYEIFIAHGPNRSFFLQLYKLRNYATHQLRRKSSAKIYDEEAITSFTNKQADEIAKAIVSEEANAEQSGRLFYKRGE